MVVQQEGVPTLRRVVSVTRLANVGRASGALLTGPCQGHLIVTPATARGRRAHDAAAPLPVQSGGKP